MRPISIRTAGAVAVVIAALMSTSALAGVVRSASGAIVTNGAGLPVTDRGEFCDHYDLQLAICLDPLVDRTRDTGGASVAGVDTPDNGNGDNGNGNGNGDPGDEADNAGDGAGDGADNAGDGAGDGADNAGDDADAAGGAVEW